MSNINDESDVLKFQKYAQNSTHGERFITEEATLLYKFAPGQLSV